MNLHAFSPPEIHQFTKVNRMSLRDVLIELKAAGLGSLPGGGGEILVDRVRKQITRGKVLSDDWLNVMRVWHELGGIGSATMMFGHVETLEDRIEHLERLRQLQDETAASRPISVGRFSPSIRSWPTCRPRALMNTCTPRLCLDCIWITSATFKVVG